MRQTLSAFLLFLLLGHLSNAQKPNKQDEPALAGLNEIQDHHAALDAALEEYNAAMAEEVSNVLAAIQEAFNKATQSGDLELAKKARAAEQRLREHGDPPTDTFMKRSREEAQRNINRAAKKLQARYDLIAKQVLKTGNVDGAEAIVSEANEIISHGHVWRPTSHLDRTRENIPPTPTATARSPTLRLQVPLAIEMVVVGDPDNPPDSNGYGSVPYVFKIGQYEITIAQYCRFLNAVAKADPHGLYDEAMLAHPDAVAIERRGNSGGYSYHLVAVSPLNSKYLAGQPLSDLRPITHIEWQDAARFCNWMHNGQKDDGTENGAYELHPDSRERVARQPGARFFIPTEDEWYKAAYYAGPSNKLDSPKYYQYATQSDEAPTRWHAVVFRSGLSDEQRVAVASRPLPLPNIANWGSGGGHHLAFAPVNHFPQSVSHYGCHGMSGNVAELVDPTEPLFVWVYRGGTMWSGDKEPTKEWRVLRGTAGTEATYGFRIGSPLE